ncbi:MAG TPA: chitobiase/beta-hexosaminidase C-terminal domain-containing protein, partial [Candidatus Acidoferrales bacterium]|nr:chitobiase/beta-hexosaminidase C-terminal domain-containing protein [Candidatus Acidoferrales bacterium]
MKKVLLLLALLLPVLSASAQVDVLTQHNDNMRTGQNINEIILTPSNVNSSSFGKLFKTSVDGFVYAQPLYMSNVAIAGGTHNVVYVATENDSVYAFDADNGTQLWHASLVDANHGGTTDEKAVPVGDLAAAHCNNVKPLIGITSTPVIDRNTSSMYVEAKSELANGSFIHRLHMLDITTGAEISPGPSQITATVPGTGEGGTTITFNDATQFNRPGLLFLNGTVYIAYASHCDSTPYHGWIFAYNASSLARTAVFVANPNGTDAGIWMSGAGLAADSNGSIFSVTGNGTFDSKDFGDSIFKLILSGSTLALTDYFTPYNQSSLNSTDGDLGSGGVLLLPDQPGTFSHELIEAGKRSTIYLINRDQMTTNNTHYCSGCSSDSEIVQELTSAVGGGIWSMPAYWNNNVYFWGTNDYLKAFGLSNGRLTTSTSHSSMSLAFPGATPSVSSNGNTNGIVWAIDSSKYDTGPAVLHAFDATNVSHELWNSSQAANGRDTAGLAVKFTVPTIANGKVYIGAQGELDAYGLLGSGSGQVATPTFSPAPGTYTAALPVMISDATSGATIYYTADGTTPTTASPQYSAPITVSNTETIEAIAAASGMTNSAVATGIYTIQTSGGGSSPSYGSGFTSLGLTLNGGAAISGTRLRLTDGGTGEARSAFFTSPVNVQSFTNDFNFQLTNANADGFTFTIQGNSSTALGAPGGALGYGPNSTNTIPGIGRSAAVGFQLYSTVLGNKAVSLTGSWTNGASPSATPGVTTTGVDLHSGDLMNVHMTYDGTTLMWTITDSSTGKSFTQSVAINIPALAGNTAYVGFTGGTGGLTATQDILTWTYTSNLAAPSITTQPANQTVVIGQAATFSVVASGTAPLTYQWMENTGSGFNNISGANSSSYTTPPATSTDNGTAFEVLVTNAEGSVTSNSATLTVTSPLPPTITTQPANQTVLVGQTATFSVVATGTAPLTYQWAENTGSGFNNISGANSSSYTTPPTTSADNGTIFEVTVSNAQGSATSNPATLTANTAPPTITTQPANQSVIIGQTATFSVVATGTAPLTYQWTANTGSGFNNISGATSSSYTTPPAMSTDNGTAFEVVVSNAEGSVTSNAAALTVNAAVTQPSYGSGFTTSGLTLNGGALISGTRLRLTNGGGGEARSAFFSTEVNVQSFTNDFSFQLTNAIADGFTFTIQGNSPTALGAPGGSLGYGPNGEGTIPGIAKSVAVGFQL